MDNMNLNQLKYFFDAATEQSVAKAAQRNFVSQPAISQAIKKLGESLGVKLLVHGKNRFQLTDNGRLVFQKCQAVFSGLVDMRNELKAFARNYTGEVRFATAQSIAITLLPDALKGFRAAHPAVVPKFKLGRTSLNRQWLEEGLVEFVIAVDDGGFKGFDKQVLHTGHFLAIELATKSDKKVEPSFMIAGTYRPEAVGLAQFYEKKFRKPLPVGFEIESWEVITQLAFKGLGVALVPDFIVKRQSVADQNRLRYWPIPKFVYEVCIFSKKGRPFSRNAQVFLDSLVNV